MKPLRNNVIVSRIEPKLTTESGIILKNPLDVDQALIEAIGPDVTEVVVGERVCLDWSKSKEIEPNKYIVPITEVAFVYED